MGRSKKTVDTPARATEPGPAAGESAAPGTVLTFPGWTLFDNKWGKWAKRGSRWADKPDVYMSRAPAVARLEREVARGERGVTNRYSLIQAEIRIPATCAPQGADLACTYTQLELPITTERNSTDNAASD